MSKKRNKILILVLIGGLAVVFWKQIQAAAVKAMASIKAKTGGSTSA